MALRSKVITILPGKFARRSSGVCARMVSETVRASGIGSAAKLKAKGEQHQAAADRQPSARNWHRGRGRFDSRPRWQVRGRNRACASPRLSADSRGCALLTIQRCHLRTLFFSRHPASAERTSTPMDADLRNINRSWPTAFRIALSAYRWSFSTPMLDHPCGDGPSEHWKPLFDRSCSEIRD